MSASLPAFRPLLRAAFMLGALAFVIDGTGCGSHGGSSSNSVVDGALVFTWAATTAPTVSPASPTASDPVVVTGRLRCSTAQDITTPVRVLVTLDGTTVLDTSVNLTVTVLRSRTVPQNLYTVDLNLALGQLAAGTDRTLTVTIDPDNAFGVAVTNASQKSFTQLITIAPAGPI